MLTLEKFSPRSGRPFRAPGAGAAPRLPDGGRARRQRHSRLEQIEPRTPDRRLRTRERPRRRRRRGARARLDAARTTSTPTISISTTVDRFLDASDFYTLDVASAIGKPATPADIDAFVARHPELIGRSRIPGIEAPFVTTRESITEIARQLPVCGAGGRPDLPPHRLSAATPARSSRKSRWTRPMPRRRRRSCWSSWRRSRMRRFRCRRSRRNSPAASIRAWITSGDVAQFEKEFSDDLAVIAHAVVRYGLPANLKLSVHSGSDKFSIYAPIRRALRADRRRRARQDRGHHVARGADRAGRGGRRRASRSRRKSTPKRYAHREELCEPYAAVIDIDYAKLPRAGRSAGWTRERVHVGAAPRSEQSRVQPECAAVAARRI